MSATPTPTPVPAPTEPSMVDNLLGSITTAGAAAYVASVVAILVAAVIIAFAVLRASKYPPPTSLITALSLLTLFSVAGGIATNNDEAWTIAAAGIGALAGSVTSIFQGGKPGTVEKAVAVVQELERREQTDEVAELDEPDHPEMADQEPYVGDDPGLPPDRRVG